MNKIKHFNSFNSKRWLISLLSYFKSIKSIDDNIESLRVDLCSQNDFTSNKLFQYLDSKNKHFLSLNDFLIFLHEMKIPFDEKYLRKFIHNFDKDSDFSLNFQEFLGLILPKKNIDLKNKVLLDANKGSISEINNKIKIIFGKILYEELELVRKCIENAKFCRWGKGFTLFESFVSIAGNEKYITEKNLFEFLKKNNININNNDIHQLMFRLDADNDGRISFNEFKEIFFPMKEGELVNTSKNIKESDYKFYTISSFADKDLKKRINISNNSYRIKDINFNSKNQKINLKNSLIKKPKYQHRNYLSKLLKEEKYNFNYQSENNNNIKSIFNNNIIYSQTENFRNTNKLSYQNKNIIHGSYRNLKDINNDYTSSLIRTSTFKNNNNNYRVDSTLQTNLISHLNYKSPKIKHTKRPLFFDYSTYSDEDGDEYFNQRKFRYNAKSAPKNYQIITNYNDNIINSNNLKIEYEKKIRPCCGCYLFDILCPCPINNKNYKNCICPKNKRNSFSFKNIYPKSYEEAKNSNKEFKVSINSHNYKSKYQLNFFYNNYINEKDINERKFDERRLFRDKIK